MLELAYAIFYGDLIMSVFDQTKPYEKEEGAAAKAREDCVKYIRSAFDNKRFSKFARNVKYILNAFESVPVKLEPKVKVGIVGRSTSSIPPWAIRTSKISCFPRAASPSCPPSWTSSYTASSII